MDFSFICNDLRGDREQSFGMKGLDDVAHLYYDWSLDIVFFFCFFLAIFNFSLI